MPKTVFTEKFNPSRVSKKQILPNPKQDHRSEGFVTPLRLARLKTAMYDLLNTYEAAKPSLRASLARVQYQPPEGTQEASLPGNRASPNGSALVDERSDDDGGGGICSPQMQMECFGLIIGSW